MATTAGNDRKLGKYLFKGHAVALRGSIRKPYYQELGNHLEVSTYAGSSGHMRCTNRDFSVASEISYQNASTEIVAEKYDGHLYQSVVQARVEHLRIGGRFSVDEVICRLRSVYDGQTYPERMVARISPAGSTIKGLKIDGKEQKLELPPAFEHNERTENAFFRGELKDESAFQPGSIPEPIYVKNLGTIFYAEWTWIHPQEQHRQRLTMLRLALGSDLGADVDLCGADNDGSGWPPLAP